MNHQPIGVLGFGRYSPRFNPASNWSATDRKRNRKIIAAYLKFNRRLETQRRQAYCHMRDRGHPNWVHFKDWIR